MRHSLPPFRAAGHLEQASTLCCKGRPSSLARVAGVSVVAKPEEDWMATSVRGGGHWEEGLHYRPWRHAENSPALLYNRVGCPPSGVLRGRVEGRLGFHASALDWVWGKGPESGTGCFRWGECPSC